MEGDHLEELDEVEADEVFAGLGVAQHVEERVHEPLRHGRVGCPDAEPRADVQLQGLLGGGGVVVVADGPEEHVLAVVD